MLGQERQTDNGTTVVTTNTKNGFLSLVEEGRLVIDVPQAESRQDSRHSLQYTCGFPEGEVLHAKSSWRRARNERKKKRLSEEELRENFCCFSVLKRLGKKKKKTWHVEWSPGNAGRKDTEASVAAGSCINVMKKEKVWSRAKIMAFAC